MLAEHAAGGGQQAGTGFFHLGAGATDHPELLTYAVHDYLHTTRMNVGSYSYALYVLSWRRERQASRCPGDPNGHPYRDLFAAPGTAGLALAGLLARLPLPMTGIGIITLLSQLRGSYALAGAVSATFVLTYALLSPQVSRWVDRRGQGRVLPWATAASAAGLLLLLACTLLAAPDWALFVAAMLAGCMPSVSAMVRARWTAIHRGRPQLQTAYSLETVFDEVTFIVGPPLSVGLSVAVWPQAGVLAAALLLVVGVAALVLQRGTEPPLQQHDGATPRARCCGTRRSACWRC